MSAISKRQENHFICVLRVAACAAHSLRDDSGMLCSIDNCGCHGVPRWALQPSPHSTFGQGFALLAFALCSFQHTSRDEERERKPGTYAGTPLIAKGFETFSRHEICRTAYINSEAILWLGGKVLQGPFKHLTTLGSSEWEEFFFVSYNYMKKTDNKANKAYKN